MDHKILTALAQGQTAPSDAELKLATSGYSSHFYQMIVLEVISDPKQITREKVDYWTNVLKIGLSWSAKYLNAPLVDDAQNFPRIFPRNTIIVQRKLNSDTSLTPPTFALPFFPSHMSLPCKPGELVWVMYENPDVGGEKIPYWMCSVVQPHYIDDVNHTHAPMALRQILPPKTAPADLKIPYQLRNGSILLGQQNNKFIDEKGNPIIISDKQSRFLSTEDLNVFEKLITITDASKISSYEAVPRFYKRPGDIVLEGSNNSLIVLGTERTGPLGLYEDALLPTKKGSISIGKSPMWPPTDFQYNAGCIDIVTGRGYTPETGGSTNVEVTEIANPKTVLKEEIDKINSPVQEGDPDFINDRSRILISQKSTPDTNFNLSNYFSSATGAPRDISDSAGGDASVVIKSDKIRLIARSDISFIVTNFQNVTPTPTSRIKDEYKNEAISYAEYASITIKSNGDIVFTPSEKGLIKLGGDDADKAILCTDNLAAKPTVKDGQVTGPAITKDLVGVITTGADIIGTGKASQGTFATKILVK